MGQQSCGKHQLRIHSEKDQHLGQSLMKPCQSEETSSHTLFLKCVELLGVGKQGLQKKVKYCQSAWITNVPNIFVFYSVPFYEYIKPTNKALIRKPVLLKSCKHGQILQLNCALA